MKKYKEIPKNTLLYVGDYRLIFKLNLFPNQVSYIIENLSDLIEKTYNIVADKPIRIKEVYTITDKADIYLAIEFELLKNPVPVALIVAGVVGLLGLVGSFLIFEKIEQISKTPLASGLGISLGVGSIILIITSFLFLYKKIND